MLKWSIIVAVLLGLSTAALGKLLVNAKADARVARIEAAKLSGQLNALQERYDRAAVVRQAGEQYKIEVQNAANKTEWGAVAVPSNVANELCKRAKCAASDTMPPPSSQPSK